MTSSRGSSRLILSKTAATLAFAALAAGGVMAVRPVSAEFPWFKRAHAHHHGAAACTTCVPNVGEGAWYWMRSPEQERQVVMALFARYCVRCHGVDGRGVWDIPGIPDFTNLVWQGSRPDPALVRSVIEGRGAVMPPFRGTLTLEEAWGMARYLRTFVPGTEVSRPDLGPTPAAVGSNANSSPPPASSRAPAAGRASEPPPPLPSAETRGAFAR